MSVSEFVFHFKGFAFAWNPVGGHRIFPESHSVRVIFAWVPMDGRHFRSVSVTCAWIPQRSVRLTWNQVYSWLGSWRSEVFVQFVGQSGAFPLGDSDDAIP